MKNILQSLRLPIGLVISFLFCLAGPILTVHAQDMQFSDEDIKFLEEAQKEVTKYVENLPSEAELRAQGLSDEQIKSKETKEKFQREVDRLSKMSEEDLIKEIEKAIGDVNAAQTPPQPGGQEETLLTMPAQEVTIAEPAKPIIPSNKQQQALHLIDSTLISINNFLCKAQMMVELPNKITSWSKTGKLRSWPSTLNWGTLKTQIDGLVAKLTKLKDKDPKSNNYKYLDDFIKDEALQNNLTKVKDSLIKNEPRVELGSFGIDKMTSASRQATRSVLLTLHEAISALAIPIALDKIFEKYEPTAKKIKESEETAQKRALEQSRQSRTAGSSTYAGVAGREHEYTKHYDSDRGRGGYGSSYDMPDSARSSQDKSRDSSSLGAPAGGTGGGAKGQADAKKDGDQKKATDAKEKAKFETDKKAQKIEDAFDEAIGEFKELFDSNPNFKNLEKHMLQDLNVPFDSKLIKNIEEATKELGRANQQVKNIKKHLPDLSDTQKKSYKKSFKDTLKDKDLKADFDKLITQINTVSKSKPGFIVTLVGDQPIIYRSKDYAYFTKETQKKDLANYVETEKKRVAAAVPPVPLHPEVQRIDDLLKNPVANLDNLKTKIQALRKAVEEL